MKGLCIAIAVGLTPRLARSLEGFSSLGQVRPLEGVFPALTLPAQASLYTGKAPREHGVVANGWYHSNTQEIRFWLQSAALLKDPIWEKQPSAQVFSWFAQGSSARASVLPKPHYGCDGSKAFGILDHTGLDLEASLGNFPFPSFWGPFAGLPSSQWIRRATQRVIEELSLPLTFAYLPHLDYAHQKQGPGEGQALQELLDELKALKKTCEAREVELVVLSEYGIEEVHTPLFPNRVLLEEGWLKVRPGPFGSQLLPWDSSAFAVCDHQVALLTVQNGLSPRVVAQRMEAMRGVEHCKPAEDLGLGHVHAGDLVMVAEAGHWFDYTFWKSSPPDYENTVDIHRKPGYDPTEMFLSTKWKLATRLLQKKMGLRVPMDVIRHDPQFIGGSHGRFQTGEEGPVIIAPGSAPSSLVETRAWIEDRLG